MFSTQQPEIEGAGTEQEAKPLPKIGEAYKKPEDQKPKKEEASSSKGGEALDALLEESLDPSDGMDKSKQQEQKPKPSEGQETVKAAEGAKEDASGGEKNEEQGEEEKGLVYTEEDLKTFHHYFDTQKIYSGLKYSGFTDGQAEVLMLTVKDMLVIRLAKLKENSYPISAAENEAYLFEAACSEMRNDIQISRQVQAEEYRSSQAALQRDVEILQQEMNEMISTLKSEVEMEVNERKNSTKAEETTIDLRIQELNNRITIDIISDIKSKIEALRWQTTRRGLIAVLMVAFLILTATSATKKEEKQSKRRGEPVSVVDEYQVPVLSISEVDDSLVEDRNVESLNSKYPTPKKEKPDIPDSE